ncbi:MAG: hypothetical protein ACK5DD_07340 [Cyclobacteriaceae bacterium]|jgi:hypothetical protein
MVKNFIPFFLGLIFFISCSEGSEEPKVSGCTDSLAVNYNELANADDGSCVFPADELVGTWAGKDEVSFFSSSTLTTTPLPTVNYTATVTKTDKLVVTIVGNQPSQVYIYKGPLTIDWSKKTIGVRGTTITGTINSDKSFTLNYVYGLLGGAYTVKQTYTR